MSRGIEGRLARTTTEESEKGGAFHEAKLSRQEGFKSIAGRDENDFFNFPCCDRRIVVRSHRDAAFCNPKAWSSSL